MESYKTPRETFETNVMGTANLLNSFFKSDSASLFVGVTTDKVYKNVNAGNKFLEDDALEGKDPYSASKVATESVLRAWQNISSLEGGPTVLSLRAGNVIGGGDLAPNRIFPDIVRNLFFGENLEIRNLGSTRPWQHVIDPLNGYITAANNALSTRKHQNFNFGPVDASLPVSELLDIVKKHRGKDFENIRISNAISKHESELLDLNSEKANQVLGWQPVFSQKEAILSTIKWWENVENHELSPLEACERDLEYLVRGSTKK